MEPVRITDYHPDHQDGINRMMSGIEKEFPVSITSPQSTRINEAYLLADQKFWVALHETKVVGTAGLSLFKNQNAVLKRMMVDKDFRGKLYSTATLLLDKSMDWAREQGFKTLYLGTMAQFKAAQKFYLTKGFIEIKREELPADYSPNPIDALFYKIDL